MVDDNATDTDGLQEFDDALENSDESQGQRAAGDHSYPVVPLRDTVVFPHQVLPLTVGRDMSMQAVDAATDLDQMLIVVAQKDPSVDRPRRHDVFEYGTLARILKVFQLPDQSSTVLIQGQERVRIDKITRTSPYFQADITSLAEDEPEMDTRTEALVANIQGSYQRAAELAPYLATEHVVMVHNTDSPGELADFVTSTLQLPLEDKQGLLETPSTQARLEQVIVILAQELDILELSSKIHDEVQGEISKSQREYFLREQIRAIRRELGEGVDGESDIDELRARIAKCDLPEEAEESAKTAINRLERINPASPEYNVNRTWLEWILDVPWSKTSEDCLDLKSSRRVLDDDHHGLEKVKKRILEFLAVRKLKNDMKGPILCLVGPPGVGKTSLGRSIANALGRRFQRISLGGMRDEAEIRGHRRTYVGALPGRIIQGLKKAGTNNPVFMLDELDKLGRDFHGDPSSALLEVLDPEQNNTFTDHYLETPVDLSNVLFIATANWKGAIPAPLLDRMEIIDLHGYTEEEKVKIAQNYLVPKQTEAHGLKARQFSIGQDALEGIISGYTREAGVRNLERTIATVARGVVSEIVEGKRKSKKVQARDLKDYVGPQKFFSETLDRTRFPGIATGLAWTPYGGEVLFIEATQMKGAGRLVLTGKLGDVMKESARAALSYLRSHTEEFGLDDIAFNKIDIHLHIPAGAVPKDGPSAGITIVSALLSLLTGRPLKQRLAMTGEVTLRGLVLPVGGVKEKVLAARRAGIKTIILPTRNEVDLDEIPAKLRRQMKFIPVENVAEVLEHALLKKPI